MNKGAMNETAYTLSLLFQMYAVFIGLSSFSTIIASYSCEWSGRCEFYISELKKAGE
jgi:hypothetical protein